MPDKYLRYGAVFLTVIICCVAGLFLTVSYKGSEYESSKFNGVWKIEKFMGEGQMHIPGEYVLSDEEIKKESDKYIGENLTISEDTISEISPPCELGYDYDRAEDLFFGYKPPSNVSFEGKIHYEVLKHRDFDGSLGLMTDGMDNSYLDLDGYFYKIKKIS